MPSLFCPTGGTARFFSPLSIDDFCKKTSLAAFNRKAMNRAQKDIITLAMAEGLDAHANSAGIRKGSR